MKHSNNVDRLAGELASLSSLDTSALKERWKALYGVEPPSHVSRNLLIRAVAYRLQENALGGVKPQTLRFLARQGGDAFKGGDAVGLAPRPKLKPGVRIVREWHGTTHHVTGLEDGVLFQGRRYGSLSEVARVITGSRWSGPRFFGLDSTVGEKPNGKS